jgi:hypothetical protein
LSIYPSKAWIARIQEVDRRDLDANAFELDPLTRLQPDISAKLNPQLEHSPHSTRLSIVRGVRRDFSLSMAFYCALNDATVTALHKLHARSIARANYDSRLASAKIHSERGKNGKIRVAPSPTRSI